MVDFPDCKINIGLKIINKREDGFHNLQTVFYPLPLYDVLEIIEQDSTEQDCILSSSGIVLNGGMNDNLCVKAYRLLKKDFQHLPSIKIYLHKNIPAGAGLGGGSADAAFTLNLLNKKFNLKIEKDKLLEYAFKLGSDCPFFILNKPCFAQQRGEKLEPVSLDISSYKLIIINPGIHINTSWAFTQIKPSALESDIREIIKQPINTWKKNLTNDFETPVFENFQEIKSIKKNLYECNALYASLSGSGSTVYGIFNKADVFDATLFPNNYYVKEFNMQA